jgi:hypothetical protein
MSLMKFRAFNKIRKEVKEQKVKEASAAAFKQAFLENLSKYGATDASQLDDEQLAEFLETMKTYKIKNQTNEGNS